jgi:type IV pilus assembly protein PilB
MLIADDQLKALLLTAHITDQNGITNAEEFAKTSGATFADALIERDIISDENLGILISDYLKIPFVVLSKISIPEEIFNVIPERFARKYRVVPFSRDNQSVKVAMADPNAKDVMDMITLKTGQPVVPFLATERDIYNTLSIYRKDLQKTFDELIRKHLVDKEKQLYFNVPTAKMVEMIISYAYEDRASDIHIEPQEKDSLVRFRIDGMLHDMLEIPKTLHDQIITRLKVISRLRTDEHLAPQDGKLRVHLAEEDLDLRLSILPIVEGEKAVLRLLASKFRLFSLLDLGMTDTDLKKVSKAMAKSYGMILSTGPTGSGKTTSIYAIIKILNSRAKNITTIEDPVEYRMKGVNQIQVNAKTGLTFADGLRSILRQDPNIIFVGEIRDNETASIAVNAALTGHLVVSTLHTNDAATALPRLVDMDVEPFLVASTVNVIIAQRLMRKICDMCRTAIVISEAELSHNIPIEILQKHFDLSKELHIYQGKGCKICHGTGYKGRIGAFEVLEVSKAVRKLITQREDADAILKKALEEGMTTMLDDGLQKVAKGLTTIEEVLRVTKVETS